MAYVAVAFVFNVLNAADGITYYTWVYPLLPTKSPLMFASMCVVTFITKHRERKFKNKLHHSEEEYDEFFKSQSNSWLVSKTFAWCLFIFGMVDLVISVFFAIIGIGLSAYAEQLAQQLENYQGKDELAQILQNIQELNTVSKFFQEVTTTTGIGTAALQILFAPIVLMFSFNKPFKTRLVDRIIPLVGIAGMALVYVNWIFAIIMTL